MCSSHSFSPKNDGMKKKTTPKKERKTRCLALPRLALPRHPLSLPGSLSQLERARVEAVLSLSLSLSLSLFPCVYRYTMLSLSFIYHHPLGALLDYFTSSTTPTAMLLTILPFSSSVGGFSTTTMCDPSAPPRLLLLAPELLPMAVT